MKCCFFSLSGPPEQFESWLYTFSLEDKKGEISELLVNSPSIRALYTKMVSLVALFERLLLVSFWINKEDKNFVSFVQVPAAVAHSEFWHRYFYKVFQLDQVNLPFHMIFFFPIYTSFMQLKYFVVGATCWPVYQRAQTEP